MRSIRSLKSTERKLKCWQRDAIVAGILCDSVVHKNKHGPLGRLFNRLQQRVECFVGNLVRFVDDENFVAIARRLIPHVFAQFAHLIDAAIRRRIDFDYVHSPARRNFHAARAHAARLIGRTLLAVQAQRHNTRRRRLPRPALPGKNIAVRNTVLRNRIPQRGLDVVLIQDIVKRLRPVFSCDDLIHGGTGELCQAPGNPRHTGKATTVASFRDLAGFAAARCTEPGT